MGGLFVVQAERPRTLWIGEGAGIAPVMSEALRLRMSTASGQPSAAPQTDAALGSTAPPSSTLPDDRWRPLLLLGSDTPFPFRARPSSIIVPGIPQGVIACNPLLEAHGIANRLATRSDFPGCFDGPVTDLAQAWLESLRKTELGEVEVFACGPTALLEASAKLAGRFGVPYQAVPETRLDPVDSAGL